MPSHLPSQTEREQLRIYLVWHPDYFEGPEIARPVVAHLEGVSERLGTQPITTRVLSISADPANPHGPPAPIDAGAADLSVVILLADAQLIAAFKGPWASFRDALLAAMPAEDSEPTPGFVLPLVIALEAKALDPFAEAASGASSAAYDARQAERAYDWPHPAASSHGVTRVLLHTCRLILNGFGLIAPEGAAGYDVLRHSVFLSHAKADLHAAEAEHGVSIANRIRERLKTSNYGLDAYFDETHTVPGFGWRRQFRRAIAGSSFVAIGTDLYASRPVCQWELLGT